MSNTGSVIWQSPSNIALVKYWGKHGHQMPNNPSLSLTLKNSLTRTKVSYSPRLNFDSAVSIEFWFEGVHNPAFQDRIQHYLTRIKPHFLMLDQLHLVIESSNSFPHSAGIASSASAFSALACACQDIEHQLGDSKQTWDWFEVSRAARLGSGSACRSVFPQAALWGRLAGMEDSNDHYAIPMQTKLHETFRTLRDSILIVSHESKKVSSSLGHKLMEGHPYATIRYEEAKKNLQILIDALKAGDTEKVGFITEMEAMQLHALMLCSNPNFILMQPNTLSIIQYIKNFREDTKIPIYFTLDAGPNVHLLYPEVNKEEVQAFIVADLLKYCTEEQWIDDWVGEGPEKIDSP